MQVALALLRLHSGSLAQGCAPASGAEDCTAAAISALQSLAPSCADADALLRTATAAFGDVSWERLRHL